MRYRPGSVFDEPWRASATAVDETFRTARRASNRIAGSALDEQLVGTSLADLIDGKGGDDVINGRGGDDRLLGGAGRDKIAGDGSIRAIETTGGNDIVDGGDGNDELDGGYGNDHVLGGRGDDYLFGGYGGRDLLNGGPGHDRIGGGFLAPSESSAQQDSDILIGGPGRDIFEARFWIQNAHTAHYGRPGLGPNRDIVLDFTPGEDRLDIVLYRFQGGYSFRRGGFELLDSNGDGLLDARDLFVDVRTVAANGKTAPSLVLDVGAAMLASGLVAPGEIDPGPHQLTLHGVTRLTPSDFVPTRTYTGIFAGNAPTVAGGNADEVLVGGPADQILIGGGGNDLLQGRGGRDLFVVGRGRDEIYDFDRGLDKLRIELADGTRVGFAQLDSNRNGVLDAGDAAVDIRIEQVLDPGGIPTVGPATHIDLSGFAGGAGSSLLLYHTTGLTASDFA
ncbi:MAG: calcium-binding protein [Geminicoccaceae bacterium]|nr:calcium-binding protein [Geminicoccaceae bacterium]